MITIIVEPLEPPYSEQRRIWATDLERALTAALRVKLGVPVERSFVCGWHAAHVPGPTEGLRILVGPEGMYWDSPPWATREQPHPYITQSGNTDEAVEIIVEKIVEILS